MPSLEDVLRDLQPQVRYYWQLGHRAQVEALARLDRALHEGHGLREAAEQLWVQVDYHWHQGNRGQMEARRRLAEALGRA